MTHDDELRFDWLGHGRGGSTHLPCSRMKSWSRSTASASGILYFTACFADVEIDLAGRAADVTEIGVGHFTGAVHDATHDGDLHALEMRSGGPDPRGGGLQVEQRAAATRARHVFRLEDPRARAWRMLYASRSVWPGAVSPCTIRLADAIAEQRAEPGGEAASLGNPGSPHLQA